MTIPRISSRAWTRSLSPTGPCRPGRSLTGGIRFQTPTQAMVTFGNDLAGRERETNAVLLQLQQFTASWDQTSVQADPPSTLPTQV